MTNKASRSKKLFFATGVATIILSWPIFLWPISGKLGHVITFCPSWIFITISLLLLSLSFKRIVWQGLLGVLIFWLLTFIFVGQVYTCFRFVKPTLPNDTIRVLTWNVKLIDSQQHRTILDTLHTLNADIMFLQEIDHNSSLENLIKQHSTYRHFYFSKIHDHAILSRYPLSPLTHKSIDKSHFLFWHSIRHRVTLPNNQQIGLINVHLSSPSLSSDISQRDIRTLHYLIQEWSEENPIILGGDFNRPATHNSLHQLTSMKECFKASGQGWGKTYPSCLPLIRLDQLWITDHLKTLYTEIPSVPERDKLSDHLPVLTILSLNS